MPHARIRPTATFPRVSLSAVPAQRPPASALPLVSAMPPAPAARVAESESEATEGSEGLDAVTQHRALEVKRANDDVTQTAQVVVVPAPPVGAAGVTMAAAPEADVTVHTPGPLRVLEPRKAAAHDTKEATALVQGDVIGGLCRIEERLALSEMSVLYRAFHLQLERMVVVKVLQDAGVENVEAVARFRREARLMSLVTSEHVARVLDVGSHVGCPFIVMERLEGADLAYLLKQVGGRLSLKQACDLVLQICEALAVAHSYGIVHRDLKPANVFVSVRASGDLRVTIIDFGIAKAFFERQDAEDQLTKVNGLLGSPRYMAPEQVEPHMEVDERADIWALGILFQEMLTGERVFIAEGIGQLLMAIVDKQPVALRTHLPDAPDAIVATIAQALEKDANRRLPNALTFAARVAPFASPDAIQRVAKIAAITAEAVERAAESRPAFQERATLPPKSPASPANAAGASAGATTVPTMRAAPVSPALRAAQASSNPPPTMRLNGPVSLQMPAPVAPAGVAPTEPVAPDAVPPTSPSPSSVPEIPLPRLDSEFPEESAVALVVEQKSLALDVADASAAPPAPASPLAEEVMPAPRSRRRPSVVALSLAAGVAALAFVAVMLLRPATSDAPPPAGTESARDAAPTLTTTATSPVPATATATSLTVAVPPSASADPPGDPASVATAQAPVAARPQPSSASAPAASAAVPASGIASGTSSAVAPRPAASASAAPAAAGTGKLTVVCLPKCDRILDNGEVLGNGYVFGEEVPAGRHTLVLSTPAGAKKTMSVEVLADATKEVRVSMEK
jgi:serine/threonine protein kinase